MKLFNTVLCSGFLALGLAACEPAAGPAESAAGDVMLDNGMTVKSQIEARQENLKSMGGAMKTISDQLKLEAPDVDAVYAATQTIKGHAANLGTWFPEGTGPESGVETEALATIWEQPDVFAAAVEKLQIAANDLEATAVSRDVAAIGPLVGATGGACKNCHDTFRLKKD